MNVFIFTLGTRGDVQPYVALGRGLVAAGHRAVVCTDSRFRPLILEHGLEAAEFNGLFTELTDSAVGREIMESAGTAWQLLKSMPRLLRLSARMQQALMDDGWRAAQAAAPDLIVYHPKAFGGPHFAERLRVPVAMAVPLPMLVPTGEFPVIGFPRLPLGAAYNRATYLVLNRLMRTISGKPIARWRRSQGLPSFSGRQDWLRTRAGQPIPVLHAYSPLVGPVPADWPESAGATGAWYLDQPAGWKPGADLAAFLEAGPPPVYVGFGSMSGTRARERTELVVAALEMAGMRGVVATGWGGLRAGRLPGHVHLIDEAPHDWLFPRMATVVHHGGAGTTAAGLRAGRPTVICPFMADQPFWGQCVHRRGFGPPPLPQRKLTAERLARAIRQAVDDPGIRERTESLAPRLRAEAGVERAVQRLEEIHRAAFGAAACSVRGATF